MALARARMTARRAPGDLSYATDIVFVNGDYVVTNAGDITSGEFAGNAAVETIVVPDTSQTECTTGFSSSTCGRSWSYPEPHHREANSVPWLPATGRTGLDLVPGCTNATGGRERRARMGTRRCGDDPSRAAARPGMLGAPADRPGRAERPRADFPLPTGQAASTAHNHPTA